MLCPEQIVMLHVMTPLLAIGLVILLVRFPRELGLTIKARQAQRRAKLYFLAEVEEIAAARWAAPRVMERSDESMLAPRARA